MPRATTTERSRAMKRTHNGILIPDVPIMAGGNLPNAVKGVSAGGGGDSDNLIDLGLPSGRLWCKSNINIASETGLNDTPFTQDASYFSWGNVEGHNPVGNIFDYNFGRVNTNSPWYRGQVYGSTNGSLLTTDIPTNSDFDAAISILGSGFRMPSKADFEELFQFCEPVDANGELITISNKRTTVNGIIGVYLRSSINGKFIFFPACGYATENRLSSMGFLNYWTSTIETSLQSGRYAFQFLCSGDIQMIHGQRFLGLVIRPVANL